MDDMLSPLPHVSNVCFRLAIKKYFYKDIEPEYTQLIKDLIVGDAAETLDTLKELADALDNDAEFYNTVTTRFGQLEQTVEDNELVTAAALVDLNDRKQDALESGVNIKTVNGNSLVGNGDVTISTYRGIPTGWDTTHTMANLISSIALDSAAIPGESYMGTVSLSDLPGSMILAELIIEVMDELNGDKTVLFQLASSNTAPYKWEYVSAYGAAGEWRSWVTSENQTTITFRQW